MPDVVVFALWAPLASMGDIAVGERRAGFDRPARSAVLGLVAAALGIDRADDASHAVLDRDYLLAMRILGRGDLLQDYHTIQAPSADRKRRWATRRDALEQGKLETLLSLRDYRTEPFVEVALVARPERVDGFSPERIASALSYPAFTLSFGRKSCPLGLPPEPIVVSSSTLYGAFREAEAKRSPAASDIRGALGADERRAPVYVDLALTERVQGGLDMLHPDYAVQRIERRRDQSVSRRRWQFELRDEAVAFPARSSQ